MAWLSCLIMLAISLNYDHKVIIKGFYQSISANKQNCQLFTQQICKKSENETDSQV